jgi:[histone H3]-lysine9 N-trimethyltransferase SUV39H
MGFLSFSPPAGLRSPDPIRAGQFIDCYLGEVITKEEAELREAAAGSQQNPSYLFSLDFLVDDDNIYVVDSQRLGSPTRFMNHSCEPNCKMFPISRHHADDRIYDLAFFSLRDIPPLTELTFDYNPGWKGDKTIDPTAVKCLCGEPKCRGQLWPNQRKSTKETMTDV